MKQYAIQIEYLWGIKQTIGIYNTINEAMTALQLKKQAINNIEVVFTIITVKED